MGGGQFYPLRPPNITLINQPERQRLSKKCSVDKRGPNNHSTFWLVLKEIWVNFLLALHSQLQFASVTGILHRFGLEATQRDRKTPEESLYFHGRKKKKESCLDAGDAQPCCSAGCCRGSQARSPPGIRNLRLNLIS